jgi:AraC-like DNA-binding protein
VIGRFGLTILGMGNAYSIRKWRVEIHIDSWIPHVPRIGAVARGFAQNPKYELHGKLRPYHKFCLFQYTLSGIGLVRYKHRDYEVPANSGFLCKANNPETSYRFPEHGKEPWEFLYITFYSGQPMVESMLERYGPVFKIAPTHPEIRWMKSLEKCKRTKLPMSINESGSHINNLLMELLRLRDLEYIPRRTEEIVQMAEELIQSNERGVVTVNELANKLKITRVYLTNAFRQVRQISPGKAIMEQRIHRATTLLGEPGWSCGEIAKYLGYKNASHFSIMFKRFTGMSPVQYKKHQRNLQDASQPSDRTH